MPNASEDISRYISTVLSETESRTLIFPDARMSLTGVTSFCLIAMSNSVVIHGSAYTASSVNRHPRNIAHKMSC